MKKTLIAYGLAGLTLWGCSDSQEESARPEPPLPPQVQRTVLVYMAAQNSLAQYPYYHRQDSTEIMNGRKYLDEKSQVLLFIDDRLPPRLYRITRHCTEPELIRKWDEDFCSTDPRRFGEVLRLAREAAPGDHWGLVMWSHADGWIPAVQKDYENYTASHTPTPAYRPYSFGIDSGAEGNLSNNGANMEVTDMAEAIDRADMHCQFIFFDACLMQNLEVAYALRKVTDYVIAAPMATPAAGSYYTHNLQKSFFNADPSQIARTYLEDVQADELSTSYADYGLCISSVRTDGLEQLASALKEALPHSSLTGKRSPVLQIPDAEDPQQKHDVLYYQAFSSLYFYRPHNYDAQQALRCILPDSCYRKVLPALQQVVAFRGSTSQFWIGPGYYDFQTVPVQSGDYCGVSMFIPQNCYTEVARYPKYPDWNVEFRQTEWYRAAGFDQTGW